MLGDSPVSYWRLDEQVGPLATDETGANPGGYQGTPGSGRRGLRRLVRCLGSSVGFSGDDRVVVPDGGSLELTGDASFELWLRPADFSVRRESVGEGVWG